MLDDIFSIAIWKHIKSVAARFNHVVVANWIFFRMIKTIDFVKFKVFSISIDFALNVWTSVIISRSNEISSISWDLLLTIEINETRDIIKWWDWNKRVKNFKSRNRENRVSERKLLTRDCKTLSFFQKM